MRLSSNPASPDSPFTTTPEAQRAPESDIRELRRTSIDALERAVRVFDAQGDRASSAHARFELGLALIAEGEAAGREILEDAGTCFEEMGDETSVLAVDLALRGAADLIAESPRSFQAAYRRTDSSRWRLP
jgi:hypothetical protein